MNGCIQWHKSIKYLSSKINSFLPLKNNALKFGLFLSKIGIKTMGIPTLLLVDLTSEIYSGIFENIYKWV